MRSLRVIPALLRVALMSAAAYRESFLVDFGASAFGALGVVLPVWGVYQHTADVAGWSGREALLVTAFFLILQGLVGALVEPNLGALVDGIRTGQLDYLLLKPTDAQIAATFQRFAPARAWDSVAGVAVGAWALSGLPTPGLGEVAACVLMWAAGLGAVYGLWILVVCTSFWFVRVDNLRFLLSAVMDAGRWPVSVYTGAARFALTVIVPVALVTSWPPMALLGRLDLALGAQAVAVAAALLVVSRLAWRRAIGHYTSASS